MHDSVKGDSHTFTHTIKKIKHIKKYIPYCVLVFVCCFGIRVNTTFYFSAVVCIVPTSITMPHFKFMFSKSSLLYPSIFLFYSQHPGLVSFIEFRCAISQKNYIFFVRMCEFARQGHHKCMHKHTPHTHVHRQITIKILQNELFVNA